eukprot:scaffold143437_cov23-Tisochrysis_lutea.AAC.1
MPHRGRDCPNGDPIVFPPHPQKKKEGRGCLSTPASRCLNACTQSTRGVEGGDRLRLALSREPPANSIH